MANQPATPHRTIRVADDLWFAARNKAAAEGTNLSVVLNRKLREYLEEPMSIALESLAREAVDRYGLDMPTARADVRTLAGQIADDPDLYNEATETVTENGAELIRDQLAATH